MRADFNIAYHETMTIEGGYANDPSDHGGETWKGIARKYWPSWPGWLLIDKAKRLPGFPISLKNNQALEILVLAFYKAQFWDKNRLGELANQSIATEMFDTGVNMGVPLAAMFLQRSLNVLNRNGKTYKDIVADGLVGPTTIALTNSFSNPELLFNVLNTLQGARYISICENDKSQERFMYGWAGRVYGCVG